MSDWWKSLTLDEKKAYIKKHPRSKKAMEVKNSILAKKRRLADKYGKPLSNDMKDKAKDFILRNPSAVNGLNSSLNNAQSQFEQKLKSMDNKQIKNLYTNTVNVVKTERASAKDKLRKITAVSGIAFIAAGAISVFLGVDISSSLQLVVGSYGDTIKEHTEKVENELAALKQEEQAKKFKNHEERIQFRQEQERRKRILKTEYLKKVHEETIRQAKENLKDPDKVVDSLVTDVKPTVSPDIPVSKKETAMTTSPTKITIQSSHETDILKALLKLEKLETSSKQSVSSVLFSIDQIEAVIPTAASIMVSSIGKPSIMNRAKLLLNRFNSELASKKETLNKLAETASIKKSSLDYLIKKTIKHTDYKFEKAYVLNDSNIELCEHHTFTNVVSETGSIHKVEVYGFVKGNHIHISAVKDSNFTPKSFSVLKPRELSNWLKENI